MNLRIMMRRLNKRNLWLLLLPFLLAACQSYKKVPYFQNVEVVNEVEQQEKLYDAKIMPKDLLTIVVSCTNPELAIPFNLTVASSASLTASTSSYVTTQPVLQPYLVDNDGNIILTEGLVLQEEKIWKDFLGKTIIPESNSCELYFEEQNIERFVEKLERLYPNIQYVNRLMTHSWGQKVVRFYDLDGNLIEVGTPM